nr:isoform 2 of probable lrr receptor-like serine/threonine-protein kinase [Quercus suber]
MAVAASQSREEEVPSGGMAEETGHPMQDVQAAQDPEASKLLASPGQAIVRSASGAATSLGSEDSEASFKQSEGHEEGTPSQKADTGVNIEDPELVVPEGGVGFAQRGTFTLNQIKAAPNDFNSANKIGEDGFGPVYKGQLPDGTVIAVKQLSPKSKQGNHEFLNEIGMVSRLQHPNLV